MKKIFNSMKNKVNTIGIKAMTKAAEAKAILSDRSGEAYLDMVIIS